MATATTDPEEIIPYLKLIDDSNRVITDEDDVKHRHPSSKTPVLITKLVRIVVGDVGKRVVVGYFSRDAYDRAGGSELLSHHFQDETVRRELPCNVIAVGGSPSAASWVLSHNLLRDSMRERFSILPAPENEGEERKVPHLELLRKPCKVELCEPHARFYGMLRHEIHLTVYSTGPDGKMIIYVQNRPRTANLYAQALSQAHCRTVLRGQTAEKALKRLLQEHMPDVSPQDVARHGWVSYCTVGGEEYPVISRNRAGFEDGEKLFPLKDLVDSAIISCFSYRKETGHGVGYAVEETGDEGSPKGDSSSAETSSGGDGSTDSDLDDEGVAEGYSVAQVIDKLKEGGFTPGSALLLIRFLISKDEITFKNDTDIAEIKSKLERHLPFPRTEEVFKDMDEDMDKDVDVDPRLDAKLATERWD